MMRRGYVALVCVLYLLGVRISFAVAACDPITYKCKKGEGGYCQNKGSKGKEKWFANDGSDASCIPSQTCNPRSYSYVCGSECTAYGQEKCRTLGTPTNPYTYCYKPCIGGFRNVWCSGTSYSCCSSCDYSCTKSDQSKDKDGDGYVVAPCSDCDDNDPDINPDGSELTNCTKVDKTHFTRACRCTDGKDNDCDGDIDSYDSDCPSDLTKDLWIDGVDYPVKKNLTISGGVWVVNKGSLTIYPNITLTINKTKGLHVERGSKVTPQSRARIKFQ